MASKAVPPNPMRRFARELPLMALFGLGAILD
jgi:hypothetical protein